MRAAGRSWCTCQVEVKDVEEGQCQLRKDGADDIEEAAYLEKALGQPGCLQSNDRHSLRWSSWTSSACGENV